MSSEPPDNDKVVDVHCHLLPNLDDGPACLEEALAMVQCVAQTGSRAVVATPHMFHERYKNTEIDVVRRRFAELSAEVAHSVDSDEDEAHPQLLLGAENYLSPSFFQAFEQHAILTLNGSRYVLIEASPLLSLMQWKQSAHRILNHGLFPLIAHPERYWVFQRSPDRLTELVEMGCLVQINSRSLTGPASRREKYTARALLRKRLVHLLASDGHDCSRGAPNLASCREPLSRILSDQDTTLLLSENPSRLISDQSLYNLALPAPPASWWSRLRRRFGPD